MRSRRCRGTARFSSGRLRRSSCCWTTTCGSRPATRRFATAAARTRTRWLAVGRAPMFVSAHELVAASHGGHATRFGLVVDVAAAVAATAAALAAVAIADRKLAPLGLVVALPLLVAPTLGGH